MSRSRRVSVFNKPQTIPQWIILLAATGILFTSPYGGKAITGLLKEYLRERARTKEEQEKLNAKNVSQALYRLKKRRIIRIQQKDGKITILLTEKGRLKKLAYDLEKMTIPRPSKWDKHWRFLIFDIPKERNSARDAFRTRIKEMGLVQFQQSVWIYPYACEKEIDFLAEALKINKFLTILTVKVREDRPLRELFKELKLEPSK